MRFSGLEKVQAITVGNKAKGYSPKFYTGRLCPKVQPVTLLYSIFDRKVTPSLYLLSQN